MYKRQELDTSAVPEGRIVRTGHLGIDHLRAVVAGSSGLLFPSLDEGFGLPPLEAMAAGVPVVAADLPVTREVLGDEAAYRSPTDAEGWLDAVGDLATSPVGTPESRRLRAGAFTWAATAKATVTAYRRALSS